MCKISGYQCIYYKLTDSLWCYYSTLCPTVAAFMKIDKWSPDIPVYGDIDGGFPLVVFDSVMENAVVMSPVMDFMSANQATFTNQKIGEKTLTFGPLSSIIEVSVTVLALCRDGVDTYVTQYIIIIGILKYLVFYKTCVGTYWFPYTYCLVTQLLPTLSSYQSSMCSIPC